MVSSVRIGDDCWKKVPWEEFVFFFVVVKVVQW